MRFKRACSFMFDDPQWVKKIGIGGGMFLLPIVGPMFCLGYFRELYQRLKQGEESPLPEWSNLGDKLLHGFRLFLAVFIYSLPMYLFYFLMIGAFLFWVADQDPDTLLVSVGGGLVLLLLYLCYLFSIMPAMFLLYFRTDSIPDSLNPANHWRLIREMGSKYWIALLLGHLVYFASLSGLLLCFIGIYLTFFWANLAFFHLFVQGEKRAQPGITP